jgi:O-antigen/teichoic acid export membrane protein
VAEMERVTRVSKNAVALVAAKLVTSGLSFFMAIIINKELGPVLVGVYNYAFVLYMIFQVIPDFGIGNISIRDVSQENSRLNYYFRNIVGLRMLLGTLAFILLIATNLIVTAFQSPGTVTTEKFLAVLTIAFCLLIEQPFQNTLIENFIALERLTIVALVFLIVGVMKVGLSIYVAVSGFNHLVVWLILIYIFTVLYSIAHFYIIYHRLLKRESSLASGTWDPALAEKEVHIPEAPDEATREALAEAVTHSQGLPGEVTYQALAADFSYAELTKVGETQPDGNGSQPSEAIEASSPAEGDDLDSPAPGGRRYNREFWLYILRSAWPLAVVSSAIAIYAVVDIPILSWMKGDYVVGLYAAAAMFVKAFIFLTLAINMAVLPAISKVGGKDPSRLGGTWEKLMYYCLVMVVPVVVLTPILARPVLIIEGHDYITAWSVVWLSMAAMNFTFLTAISFPFFVVINRQKLITIIVIIGLVIKVVFNLVAIPIWGYMGTATVVVISEFITFAMLFVVLSRVLKYRANLMRFAGAPMFLLGILYAVALILHKVLAVGKDTVAASAQAAIIEAAIIIAIYLVLGFATGMFKKSRLQELNELLNVEDE